MLFYPLSLSPTLFPALALAHHIASNSLAGGRQSTTRCLLVHTSKPSPPPTYSYTHTQWMWPWLICFALLNLAFFTFLLILTSFSSPFHSHTIPPSDFLLKDSIISEACLVFFYEKLKDSKKQTVTALNIKRFIILEWQFMPFFIRKAAKSRVFKTIGFIIINYCMIHQIR